jgi:hypothetical protein
LVAFFAGNAVFLGDIFRSYAHMAGNQTIHQSVMEHGIFDLSGAHAVAASGFGNHVRSIGHAFHAYYQADVGFTQLDMVDGDVQGAHAGSAVLVDVAGIASDRQSGSHPHLAGRQGTLHMRINLAHYDFVNQGRVNPGPVNCFFGNDSGQFYGLFIFKAAQKFGYRSSASAYYYHILNFFHHLKTTSL